MINIPNIITITRIAGALSLLAVRPLSPVFFIIYTISGVSDILDGYIARKTHSESELGSKLDSIADIVFYTVMTVKLFPELYAKLPVGIWYTVIIYLILKIISYTVAALKFRVFSSLHTILNKAATLMVFFVPYLLGNSILVPYCTVICTAGIASCTEEIVIHLTSSKYKPDAEKNKK